MSRWHRRLAELRRAGAESFPPPAIVQNVQNVQNPPLGPAFEQFDHFEQRAGAPAEPPHSAGRIAASWGDADEERTANGDRGKAPRIGLPEILDEPLLLRDGRRLWRFPASAIPDRPSAGVPDLMALARGHGAVLIADGSQLVVAERWLSTLPRAVVAEFRRRAGEVIAALRCR